MEFRRRYFKELRARRDSLEPILEQVRATEADRFAAAVPGPFSSIIGAAMVREAGDRTITMDEIANRLA